MISVHKHNLFYSLLIATFTLLHYFSTLFISLKLRNRNLTRVGIVYYIKKVIPLFTITIFVSVEKLLIY